MTILGIAPQALLDLFTLYNETFFPLQFLGYAGGILCAILPFTNKQCAGRVVYTILGIFWLWIGIVFNIGYFARLASAVILFGVLFAIQGVLFLVNAWKKPVEFEFKHSLSGWFGVFLIFYGLVGYPLLGLIFGHTYPEFMPFGLVPCPTTVFTFGVLLLVKDKVPLWIMIIPLLYASGGVLPALLGIYEDIGMLLGGVFAFILIMIQNRSMVSTSAGEEIIQMPRKL